MIILDTKVVSETMKPHPDAAVVAWLDKQAAETLFLASLTLAELLAGLAAMPSGQRKRRLSDHLESVLALFEGRVLPFDTAAARRYAELSQIAKVAGHGFPVPDGYIAAIAAAHGFAVASRDVSPFAAARLTVIDPWSA